MWLEGRASTVENSQYGVNALIEPLDAFHIPSEEIARTIGLRVGSNRRLVEQSICFAKYLQMIIKFDPAMERKPIFFGFGGVWFSKISCEQSAMSYE